MKLTTAAQRYKTLEIKREPFLDRARKSVELTIPALLPKSGHTSTSNLPTPYQGIGARGVNNLASKLLLALLPPNSPFFRLTTDDFTLEQMAQQEGMRSEFEKAANKYERAIMGEIEGTAIRVTAFEALKHLIHGNVLAYFPPNGGMRTYTLDKYVVVRDPDGVVLEIIIKEAVSAANVPANILPLLKDQAKDEASRSHEKNYDLYTWVRLNGDKYTVHQEIQDVVVPETYGTYPQDVVPYLALRWAKVDGEDYGRGYVEEYYGDLKSLEELSKAIVEGSAAAAKLLFLVNPNGTTKMQSIAEAPTGAIRPGNAADVTVLQSQKHADLRVAAETAAKIEQRIAYAFLMNTAIQRNGERVTAEEIRYMAGELEDALGGVYSILSQEFQLPLVNILQARMVRQNRLPALPKDIVRPVIVTGMEALGRGHDMNKLTMFAQIAGNAAALPPEINKLDFLTRIGTSLGIDMVGLLKTPEQLQQEQQAAMMMQMGDRVGPNVVNAIGKQAELAQGAPNGPTPQG